MAQTTSTASPLDALSSRFAAKDQVRFTSYCGSVFLRLSRFPTGENKFHHLGTEIGHDEDHPFRE
jgi:hypothetical protein